MSESGTGVDRLMEQIRSCRICVQSGATDPPLPHEPRPVAVLSDVAKIRIIGQAPGTRVHASGRPFTDPSGDRLRQWMDVSEEEFYDPSKISITPMGFCFPGLNAKGGDLPPRKECAAHWQERVNAEMPQIRLVLLIGTYAQKYYLGNAYGRSLTETVSNWRSVMRANDRIVRIPLPHPSWRNNSWIKRNLWFEKELIPVLQKKIREYW